MGACVDICRENSFELVLENPKANTQQNREININYDELLQNSSVMLQSDESNKLMDQKRREVAEIIRKGV